MSFLRKYITALFSVFLIVFATIGYIKDAWEFGEAGIMLGFPNEVWLVSGLAMFGGTVIAKMVAVETKLEAVLNGKTISTTKKPVQAKPAIDCRRSYVEKDTEGNETIYAEFSNDPPEWSDTSRVGNTKAETIFMDAADSSREIFHAITASWRHEDNHWVDFGSTDINELRLVSYKHDGNWTVLRWEKSDAGIHLLRRYTFTFQGDLRVLARLRSSGFRGEFYFYIKRDPTDGIAVVYMKQSRHFWRSIFHRLGLRKKSTA